MKLPRPYIPTAPAAHQAAKLIAQARFGIQSAAFKGKTAELLELLKQYPRRSNDALYWAAGNGHVETVAALLAHNATPSPAAIAAAESNDYHKIVQMLRHHQGSKSQSHALRPCQSYSSRVRNSRHILPRRLGSHDT